MQLEITNPNNLNIVAQGASLLREARVKNEKARWRETLKINEFHYLNILFELNIP